MGSSLIGQFFQDPKYLWGRVSNTEQFPYNGEFSGGSNLSVSNPALLKRISSTVSSYQTNNNNGKKIPVDLVTASASGLDPHITIAGAFYQIPRIANARHLDQQIIEDAINIYTEYRQFWILGEPRVNVVKVNLHLDRLQDLQ